MKKILVVDASYPINTRTQRFVDSLIEEFGKESVRAVAWNRDGHEVKHKDYLIYNCRAAYANKIQKLFGLVGFRKFLKVAVENFRPDILLASHWDCLYISAGVIDKSTKLIYENLDVPTAQENIRKLLKKIEGRALKKTTAITLASRFYKDEYISFPGECLVVENKQPCADQVTITPRPVSEHLNLSYIGGVRYANVLKNAVDAIRSLNNVTFHIFGGGVDLPEIEDYAQGMNNIVFHGPYNYKDIAQIYQQTDLVWAVYPSNDHNVKYAISNKYHECLHYGIPGVFAKGTCLADMVNQKKAGFTVDCYSVEDIRNTLVHIADNPEILIETKLALNELKATENDNWEEEIAPFIAYIKSL